MGLFIFLLFVRKEIFSIVVHFQCAETFLFAAQITAKPICKIPNFSLVLWVRMGKIDEFEKKLFLVYLDMIAIVRFQLISSAKASESIVSNPNPQKYKNRIFQQ